MPQPSSNIDPAKARQILKDGEANGKPLTPAQRGMFGAAAGRKSLALPHVHCGSFKKRLLKRMGGKCQCHACGGH